MEEINDQTETRASREAAKWRAELKEPIIKLLRAIDAGDIPRVNERLEDIRTQIISRATAYAQRVVPRLADVPMPDSCAVCHEPYIQGAPGWYAHIEKEPERRAYAFCCEAHLRAWLDQRKGEQG